MSENHDDVSPVCPCPRCIPPMGFDDFDEFECTCQKEPGTDVMIYLHTPPFRIAQQFTSDKTMTDEQIIKHFADAGFHIEIWKEDCDG